MTFMKLSLKRLQSAGSAGEFYTPRGVTQFMVDIINPQLGESVMIWPVVLVVF